MQTRRSERSD